MYSILLAGYQDWFREFDGLGAATRATNMPHHQQQQQRDYRSIHATTTNRMEYFVFSEPGVLG